MSDPEYGIDLVVLREVLDLLQRSKVAEACGVTPGAVSSWRAGTTTPRHPALDKLATLARRPITDFYLGGRAP